MTRLDGAYCEECCQVVDVDLSNGVFVVESDGKVHEYGSGVNLPKLSQKDGWHVKECGHHLKLVQHGSGRLSKVVDEDCDC